ncbi:MULTISPECIES: hypothetical protein [unclassified Haladaptatus]|uniref:hypothetical protein n=1 Tax=unclassified Haladaptatus TaxID=2622732 RepID=UPI00209BC547|nr:MULTISPECIES: hypothetical protein [unclassified Haladaptatus]MCO8246360.1 hypothetical protein [Haladaptatus sp. AB643]MCO8255263.1 hypothetical protein [Haladaptatus sp. AB618]
MTFDGLSLQRAVLIGALLLATPFVAFFLIAGAMMTNTGLVGWLLLVTLPLSLFAVGLWLLAGETLDWTYWVRKFA